MAYLEVSGASLYYETVGDGEMFLCITGAIGNLEPFKGLAEYLKDRFKVVMYDRMSSSDGCAMLKQVANISQRPRILAQLSLSDRSSGLRPSPANGRR